ncbi:MAG: hypothetical protein FJX76_25945, partial [Armatimonadetes bacterium]|nr:hypothetical protein [Armatimonadota bacterium]
MIAATRVTRAAVVLSVLLCLAALLPARAEFKMRKAVIRDGVHEAQGALGGGDILTVIVRATPGYVCVFEIEGLPRANYMREVEPGLYVGTQPIAGDEMVRDAKVSVRLKSVGATILKVLDNPVSFDGQQPSKMKENPALSFARYPPRPMSGLNAGDTLFTILHTDDDEVRRYSPDTKQTPDTPMFKRATSGTLVSWRTIDKSEPPGRYDTGIWYTAQDGSRVPVVAHVPWDRFTTGPQLAAAPGPSQPGAPRPTASTRPQGTPPGGLASAAAGDPMMSLSGDSGPGRGTNSGGDRPPPVPVAGIGGSMGPNAGGGPYASGFGASGGHPGSNAGWAGNAGSGYP